MKLLDLCCGAGACSTEFIGTQLADYLAVAA